MSLAEHLEKRRREEAAAQQDNMGGGVKQPENMPPAPMATLQAADQPAEPDLLLWLWDRRIFGFPWSHIAKMEYHPAGESSDAGGYAERIKMFFATDEVTLRGRNLVPLAMSIGKHRVTEIREVPEKFLQADADIGAPIVVSMEIKEWAK